MTSTTEPPGTTRRNAIRGGAVLTGVAVSVWTAPVVAYAGTAPETTASPEPPKFGGLEVCKLPGRSTDVDFGYRFRVPFNGTNAQLSIDTVNLNNQVRTPECPKSVKVGDTRYFQWVVKSDNSADGAGTAIFTYTFQGRTLTTDVLIYDGTKPCKGDVSGTCP